MQNDSLEGRSVITDQMREMIQHNQQVVQEREARMCYRKTNSVDTSDAGTVEDISSSGTFSLRLFASLVILVAFVLIHIQGNVIWGYETEAVVETISQTTNLQKIADSVNIYP